MIKRSLVLTLFLITFPFITLATTKIKVQVQLTAPDNVRVFAVGFSVDSKNRGSLGKSTSKSGPAGSQYAFGFKMRSGLKVSCGTATLSQDSLVKLVYDGQQCKIDKIVAIPNN